MAEPTTLVDLWPYAHIGQTYDDACEAVEYQELLGWRHHPEEEMDIRNVESISNAEAPFEFMERPYIRRGLYNFETRRRSESGEADLWGAWMRRCKPAYATPENDAIDAAICSVLVPLLVDFRDWVCCLARFRESRQDQTVVLVICAAQDLDALRLKLPSTLLGVDLAFSKRFDEATHRWPQRGMHMRHVRAPGPSDSLGCAGSDASLPLACYVEDAAGTLYGLCMGSTLGKSENARIMCPSDRDTIAIEAAIDERIVALQAWLDDPDSRRTHAEFAEADKQTILRELIARWEQKKRLLAQDRTFGYKTASLIQIAPGSHPGIHRFQDLALVKVIKQRLPRTADTCNALSFSKSSIAATVEAVTDQPVARLGRYHRYVPACTSGYRAKMSFASSLGHHVIEACFVFGDEDRLKLNDPEDLGACILVGPEESSREPAQHGLLGVSFGGVGIEPSIDRVSMLFYTPWDEIKDAFSKLGFEIGLPQHYDYLDRERLLKEFKARNYVKIMRERDERIAARQAEEAALAAVGDDKHVDKKGKTDGTTESSSPGHAETIKPAV